MHHLLTRLRRTKMILTGLVLVVLGVVLIVVGKQNGDADGWIGLIPWNELGGILVGAGLLSVWLDYVFSREQAEIDELRLRRLLEEHAPTMRDAVLKAFAANHEDLKRVATPEMLDQMISNSLALRLDDEQFASEVYEDIRDQAIAARERWHDASLSIDLSPLPFAKSSAHRTNSADDRGALFAVTARWEYTVIPAYAERRFVCLSDRDEYADLIHARDGSSAWFVGESLDIDASAPSTFELLRFTVDGEDRPIRRSERKRSQTYTASIGAEHVKAGRPVTISYTYRTVTAQAGHMLFFEIEQPTRDLVIDFDYSASGIAHVNVLDLIPSVRPTRIERTPAELQHTAIRVEVDGWTFPRSGVAFVWTLEAERTAGGAQRPTVPAMV